MDFAQARIGNLGHMASPKMLKCSVCGHSNISLSKMVAVDDGYLQLAR